MIFWEFLIFLNLNLNFEFGPVSYRTKPESVWTGLTGNQSNRTGYRRFGEPWLPLPNSRVVFSLAIRDGLKVRHKILVIKLGC